MKKGIIITAVLIGCLVVVWFGTVATARMPFPTNRAPTPALNFDGFLSDSKSMPDSEPVYILNITVDDTKPCTLPNSYPPSILQWCRLIDVSAQQTGLPSTLIAAVMLQESSGDPLAYSSSGAVGLMQVMPRDGLAAEFMCINGPCFSDRPTKAALQDPAFNVAYGSQMLADLYAKHSSYREALFRYGPINMEYDYADLVMNMWEQHQ